MKKFYLLILCVFLLGCASRYTGHKITDKVFHDISGKRNLTNINHVYLGMTYNEVLSIMGDRFNIGYKQDESTFGILEPISVKSPYRVELLRIKNKVYNVIYYYVQIKKSDDIISEDELMPLVFEDNKLIGKGIDYLFHLKNKMKS